MLKIDNIVICGYMFLQLLKFYDKQKDHKSVILAFLLVSAYAVKRVVKRSDDSLDATDMGTEEEDDR